MQINIDCEGPITQNDNAFELCQELIPDGGGFFARVSKYDDYLADVVGKPGYKAGDTLKLVLPFLRAYGATNKIMEEFSERSLILLPGATAMLSYIAEVAPSFIISTSYRPYLEALCRSTGFSLENVFCTEVDMDSYPMSDQERKRLVALASEICSMPILDWKDEGSDGGVVLAPGHDEVLQRLDAIFWDEIPAMAIGRMLEEVNPVGGEEKARAVEAGRRRTGAPLDACLYFGDSITDVQALELVRQGGGLAVSFNGNSYALRAAGLAAVSGSTLLIGVVVAVANSGRLPDLMARLAETGGGMEGSELIEFMEQNGVEEKLLAPLAGLQGDFRPALWRLDTVYWKDVVSRSERVRKEVRGESIGELG